MNLEGAKEEAKMVWSKERINEQGLGAPISIIWNFLGDDGARVIEALFRPTKHNIKDDPISRRDFLRLGLNLLKFGLLYKVVGEPLLKGTGWLHRQITDPEKFKDWKAGLTNSRTEKAEYHEVGLIETMLGGGENIKGLGFMIAQYSSADNISLGLSRIDINNYNTWHTSQLSQRTDGLFNLVVDLRTFETREDIKKLVYKYDKFGTQKKIGLIDEITRYAAEKGWKEIGAEQFEEYLRQKGVDNDGYNLYGATITALITKRPDLVETTIGENKYKGLKDVINAYNKIYNPDVQVIR